MASRIKGITVEIVGDTSGLEKSLAVVNNCIIRTLNTSNSRRLKSGRGQMPTVGIAEIDEKDSDCNQKSYMQNCYII
ncbi:MAG TPA: hypothetical protein H9747_10180 [Candidatus Blautia stercorigallinarum]|uniref:Uncharacterized protein n=1 Tax=Candidatus Blautia stercorigallinarum TaxID=2838501 RepID=A0A9D1TFX9_9FIRM|nr:hypothetical protein [Candidatus Blautia stercorigallinarum]